MAIIFVLKESPEISQAGLPESSPIPLGQLSFELRLSPSPQYLTQQEVGSLLSISERTVRNWTRKGVLKPYHYAHRVFYKSRELAQLITIHKRQS